MIVGFITFAMMEKLNPSMSLILLPSGPLGVGIFGGVLIGLVGGVVGLIIGALGLGTFPGAAVGVLIFALLKMRHLYFDQSLSMNSTEISLALDFALVGALVGLSLPRAAALFALSR